MRILSAIVQTLMLAVFDVKAHLRPCSAVRTKLVRDHDPRRCAGGFEELPHEPLRSPGVSSTLDQDVEHETILIDRAPAGAENQLREAIKSVGGVREVRSVRVRRSGPNLIGDASIATARMLSVEAAGALASDVKVKAR